MPELNFKGKDFVYNHHLSIPFRPLEPLPAQSVGAARLDGNLIVHGDNLLALKALLPVYAGRIDVVYIDPPYNTGNEDWCYNDNVSSPMLREWLDGNPVSVDDTLRHDKWLCMMWPRLKLLHELLSETGIIAISIDDNELMNLTHILGEIFEDRNLIRVIPVINNLKGNNDEFGFAGAHEYVVFYAKNKDKCNIHEFPLDDEEVEAWDEDEHGPYTQGANLKATGQNGPRDKRPNLFFPIFISPDKTFTLERVARDQEKLLPVTNGQALCVYDE